MTDRELILRLYRLGHFWHPGTPESWNVKLEDLDALTVADRVVKDAVRSFQESDANLLPIAFDLHGRAPIADGDPGPATRQLAELPRCPVPDHPPPVGVPLPASASVPLSVLESMRAAGSGGWKAGGCDPQRQGVHSIRVSIDMARAPAKVKEYIGEALAASVACYAEIGIAVRYILQVTNDAEIVKRFEPLAGSVIGWNEFPSPNSCRKINGRFDTTFNPGMRNWANLEVHETGHGVGLQHTRGSIMNPSLLVMWPLTWRGSPSEPTLRRYYGGEPIGVVVPPPPPPGGGPGKVYVTLEVDNSGTMPTAKVVSVSRNQLLI